MMYDPHVNQFLNALQNYCYNSLLCSALILFSLESRTEFADGFLCNELLVRDRLGAEGVFPLLGPQK